MGIDTSSLMSGNFVSREPHESKYSKAREAAADARGQMNNRQNSILLAGMAACATEDTLSRRILEGKKAARRMGLDMQQNVSEKNRETLDKLKKAIEERAAPEEKTPEAADGRREETGAASASAEKVTAPAEGSGSGAGANVAASLGLDPVQQIVAGDVDIEV